MAVEGRIGEAAEVGIKGGSIGARRPFPERFLAYATGLMYMLIGRTLTVGAGLCAATLAIRSLTAATAAQDAAAPAAKGQIIPGTVAIYDYDPASAQGDGHLREYLEGLGVDAAQWYQHVMTLSNPFFEGRAPGSHGHDVASEYVEWYMREAGLQPAFAEGDAAEWTSYRQPFELPGAGPKVVSSAVAVSSPAGEKALESGKDFVVLGNSGSGSVTAPLTFVGYGIEEGQDGYTSFSPSSEQDLKGRIAVVYRYEPLNDEGRSQWSGARFSKYASAAAKFEALAKRGAAGVIMVTPPDCPRARKGLETTATSRFGDRLSIPTIHLDQPAAETLLQSADPQGRTLLQLRKGADDGSLKTVALRNDVQVSINAETTKGVIETANIGGVLPGTGSLAEEWVVVGGHYDHVGYGFFGADPRNRGKLHPGADDNASGTSAMLVLAKRISEEYAASDAPTDKRSILFMAFSAEESGLEGSDWWTKHPSLPTDRVNAMINLDMVGRLRSGDLAVGGTGTAEGFMDQLTPIFEGSGLTVRADPGGRGPSDHASFFNVGIPVLFLFTGVHDDYHKPSDFGWTVDPRGAIRVINLADQLIDLVALTPQRLAFTKPARGAGQDRGLAKVRLGVSPSYTASGKGLLVDGVSDGTSAADAGIKEGDIILSWNGTELNGAGDLAENLRGHEPGDVVTLQVERDGKTIEVKVTLKASQAAKE